MDPYELDAERSKRPIIRIRQWMTVGEAFTYFGCNHHIAAHMIWGAECQFIDGDYRVLVMVGIC